MIKVEVVERFTLADYKKLKNVEKVMARKENEFSVGDTFECDKEMADYLTGNNAFKKEVVKVIEVKPEIIPIPNAKSEEVEIVPIPNAKIEDVKIMPAKSTKKKTTKKANKK